MGPAKAPTSQVRGPQVNCMPPQGPLLMSSGPKPLLLLTTMSPPHLWAGCIASSNPRCALPGLTSSVEQPCRDQGLPLAHPDRSVSLSLSPTLLYSLPRRLPPNVTPSHPTSSPSGATPQLNTLGRTLRYRSIPLASSLETCLQPQRAELAGPRKHPPPAMITHKRLPILAPLPEDYS